MPGEKSKHISKWDRCVKKVKEKNPDVNPYAICSASIQDAGLKKKYQRRPKSEYYANKKRGLTKEHLITKFENFVNESDEFFNDYDEYNEIKAEELYRQFIEEHDTDLDYTQFYIENWLLDRGESIDYAYYIYDKLFEE